MELNLETLKNLSCSITEPALRKDLGSLHKEHYRVFIDQILDALLRNIGCVLEEIIAKVC